MSDSELHFQFVAPVLRLETGLKQHYVPVPAEMAGALRAAGVRRVIATINNHTLSRGLQSSRNGEQFLMMGVAILREAGAKYGDMVQVSIFPDPKPDLIEVCDELAAALELDDAANTRFQSMVPSKRRGLNYYVDSAKRDETREKRALEIAKKLRTYTLYGDQRDG